MRALIAVCALAATASADDTSTPIRTPFDQFRFGASAGAGTQSNFGMQYIWIGAGVEFFVLDGVGVSLAGLYEFGGGPSIGELSPGLRYVAQPLVGKWPVVPYVGTFYSHWFVGGANPDVNAIGARAGLLYVSGQLVLGLGAAVSHQLSCTSMCDTVYPDLTLGVAF